MTVTPVDLRAYVDLTVYDRNPGSLVERAINDAVAKLPGWVPREGLTEMVLIEALALEVAELVYAINRVPGAVAETILRLYGLDRDQGAAAIATVEFTFVDNVGRTVPAGSRLRIAAGGQQWLFVLDADATAAPGNLTAAATATAARLSAVPNGTPVGTVVELLDLHYYVDHAQITVAPAGGRDAETTALLLARASARFTRLNDALVLPPHFTAVAVGTPGIFRATTLDQYNPAVGPSPGSNPGHVTIAVMGENGVAATAPAKAALQATIDGPPALRIANLFAHVVDATVTAVPVTVTVAKVAGWADADVVASVTAALNGYLDPNVWPWGATVYRNELISLIDQAAGVDRVVTLTLPAADVALAGFAPLADAGAIVVNVA
jgi:hypothetical protein